MRCAGRAGRGCRTCGVGLWIEEGWGGLRGVEGLGDLFQWVYWILGVFLLLFLGLFLDLLLFPFLCLFLCLAQGGRRARRPLPLL